LLGISAGGSNAAPKRLKFESYLRSHSFIDLAFSALRLRSVRVKQEFSYTLKWQGGWGVESPGSHCRSCHNLPVEEIHLAHLSFPLLLTMSLH
jgi:hypothetical protein